MRTFTAGDNDAGMRMDRFTAKVCPALPTSLLYKYIRIKRIKVNGKRTELSYRLAYGDKVDMYINDDFFMKMRISLLSTSLRELLCMRMTAAKK